MDKETDNKIASLYEKIRSLDGCELKDLDLLLDITIQKGFEFGEQRANKAKWINTKDKVPDYRELVLTSSKKYGFKLLTWNNFYRVWDNEEGDDYFCERYVIDAWIKIPEYGS